MQNVSHGNHLIFMRMTVQVTYIFIPIVSHKDSFCNRGKSKLGIGLFIHERGPVRGGLYVRHLNFKPFHVAILEGSPVTVGISRERLVVHRHLSFFIPLFQSRVACWKFP